MFNYYNLNDVEFESLCKDVMERMLSTQLRIFSKGKDGGIDLTDSSISHNIIVQVKHYIRSTFSNLRTTLKKEQDKIDKLKPNEYYICCGMELTDANIQEICGMFPYYMESDRNIVTLIEIDEFLQKPENIDIVRKHYKLWLYSSNILNQVYNQNIFIDCESLLSDIEEECKYFVQTEIYNICLDCLDKHRMLMLTGGPGVGKTMTSKMLVLYYASQGYTVRYTTNGDISDIKRSLSIEKDSKEIVLLDDCLGQHYINMKESLENELTSLVKYIKMHENKKLILNSRITILNEAKERFESFGMFLAEKKINEFTINMDKITALEKAKIFYNHLVFKHVPCEYYNTIKRSKNYLKIVMHDSYTPRIIEHITLRSNYLKCPPERYCNYILQNLDNPQDIWRNEYYQRLREEDRAFLTTLYSLTDTNVGYSIIKKCFEQRISQMKNIDHTVNIFEMTVTRLNQSIIKIIEDKGKMLIGVINPSVNDFLKQIFYDNALELSEIRQNICHFLQFRRCYSDDDFHNAVEKIMLDKSICNVDFLNETEKVYFIVANICQSEILDKSYQIYVKDYFWNAVGTMKVIPKQWSHEDILNTLLHEPFYSYYSVKSILNISCVESMLDGMELDDLIDIINILWECFNANHYNSNSKSQFNIIFKDKILEEISIFIGDVDLSDYSDGYDIGSLLSKNCYHEEYGTYLDEKEVIRTIEGWLKDDIYEKISDKLGELNGDISLNIKIPSIDIDASDIDSIVKSYLEPSDIDDYEGRGSAAEVYIDEIESIFER